MRLCIGPKLASTTLPHIIELGPTLTQIFVFSHPQHKSINSGATGKYEQQQINTRHQQLQHQSRPSFLVAAALFSARVRRKFKETRSFPPFIDNSLTCLFRPTSSLLSPQTACTTAHFTVHHKCPKCSRTLNDTHFHEVTVTNPSRSSQQKDETSLLSAVFTKPSNYKGPLRVADVCNNLLREQEHLRFNTGVFYKHVMGELSAAVAQTNQWKQKTLQ